MRPRRSRLAPMPLALALGLAIAAVGGSCSGGHARHANPSSAPGVTPAGGLYVAIGASETRGVGTENPLREAWTQDLFRTLPRGYSFVNLGIPGANVATALESELPIAESLHPTLVTVWLNVDDLLDLVPVDRYESELGELIRRLRATGATVLVANTPALDELPAYLACVDPSHHPQGCAPFVPQPVPPPAVVQAAVAGYNSAIARAVTSGGAVLVDLHAGLLALAQGQNTGQVEASLVSDDGFHPNAAGHQRVADRFAATLSRLPLGAGVSPPKAAGG